MSTYPFQRQNYRKLVTIESQNRVNKSESAADFTYSINMPQVQSYNSICVLYLELDKSYYMIQQDEEELFLGQTGALSSGFYLSFGNYSGQQLAMELQDALNETSATAQQFTVQYFPIGNIFGINSTDNAPFSIDFTDARLLAQYFGFPQELVTSDMTGELDSEYPANLQRYQNILLLSDMGVNGSNGNDVSVLATIYPCSNSTNSVIAYKAVDAISSSVTMIDRNQNQFRFTLVDSYNNQPITLPVNANVRMTICLSQEKI